VIDLSSICCGLAGHACKGLIVRLGDAREWMLAAKQQRYERQHAEELAARRAEEAQALWRRAQRASMAAIDNPQLKLMARQVGELLQRVVASL
jgi:hypothetical protein